MGDQGIGIGRLVCLGLAVVGLVGCWPAPGQGPNRTGYNELEDSFDAGSVGSFGQVWTAPVGDLSARGVGPPVISTDEGARLHVTSGRTVYTFDAGTGEQLWESVPHVWDGPASEVDAQVITHEWIHTDRPVLVTSARRVPGGTWSLVECDVTDGDCWGGEIGGRAESLRPDPDEATSASLLVSRFDRDSGAQDGQVTLGRGPRIRLTDQPDHDSRLTVGTDRMFHAGVGVGTAPDNGVRAFPITGGDGWSTAVDGTGATSPVLSPDGSTVYVGTDAGTVHALATSDGTLRWSAPVGAAVTAAPALAEGRLHVPTADGLVTVSASGDQLWSSTGTGAVTVQPAVAAGVVFTGTGDGVRAHDATGCTGTTCDALWSASTGSEITGAPAVSGGHLYVGTGDGRVIAFAPLM